MTRMRKLGLLGTLLAGAWLPVTIACDPGVDVIEVWSDPYCCEDIYVDDYDYGYGDGFFFDFWYDD